MPSVPLKVNIGERHGEILEYKGGQKFITLALAWSLEQPFLVNVKVGQTY